MQYKGKQIVDVPYNTKYIPISVLSGDSSKSMAVTEIEVVDNSKYAKIGEDTYLWDFVKYNPYYEPIPDYSSRNVVVYYGYEPGTNITYEFPKDVYRPEYQKEIKASGTLEATEPGSYEVTFELDPTQNNISSPIVRRRLGRDPYSPKNYDDLMWEDGTKEIKKITWTLRPAKIKCVDKYWFLAEDIYIGGVYTNANTEINIENKEYIIEEIVPEESNEIYFMFSNIKELPPLNLTESIERISFIRCGNLEKINPINTEYIKEFYFDRCSTLKELPPFNAENATSITIRECENLEKITFLNAENIEEISFFSCSKLSEINELNLSKVIDMRYLFNHCTSLPPVFPWPIDVSSLAEKTYTGTVNNVPTYGDGAQHMFYGSSVTEVTFKNASDKIKPYLTSQNLKGDDSLTVHFM